MMQDLAEVKEKVVTVRNYVTKSNPFLDVKQCEKRISRKKLEGKSVFLSSVTDCYNRFNRGKPGIRRRILV